MRTKSHAEDLTHRRVLRIAAPIIASNITIPLIGALDTAVIGQLGQAQLIAAVGLGASILATVYWAFGFLRMATTGLAAQAIGRGDEDELWAIFHRALWIAGLGGMILALAVPWWSAAALWVAPAQDGTEAMAREYLYIRALSAPAAVALLAVGGWLIAAERTRALFGVQIVIAILNVVLNIWFVLSLSWGVSGVAWASVIAEYVGLLLGLGLCFGAQLGRLRPVWGDVLRLEAVKRLFTVSRDIMLRSLMLQAVVVSVTFLGAGFGDTTLAANQVLFQFWHIVAYGLDGFAFAAETLVGQAVGQRRAAPLHRAVKLTAQLGFIGAALCGLVIWLGAPRVIDYMTTAQDVRDVARHYVIYAALAPVLGFASWLMDGVFIGATRSREMRDMMFISMVAYFALAALIVPLWGNHGIWFAYSFSLVIRAVTLGARYPALLREVGGS